MPISKNYAEKQIRLYRKKGMDLLFLLFMFNALLTYITSQSEFRHVVTFYSVSTLLSCLMTFLLNISDFTDKSFMLFEGIIISMLSVTFGVLSVTIKGLFLGGGVIEILFLELIGLTLGSYLAYRNIKKKFTVNVVVNKKIKTFNSIAISMVSILGILVGKFLVLNMTRFGNLIYLIITFLLLFYIFSFVATNSLIMYKKL